jgi:putative DNA primase/helicase
VVSSLPSPSTTSAITAASPARSHRRCGFWKRPLTSTAGLRSSLPLHGLIGRSWRVQLTYLNARTGAKACISAPRITVGQMGTGAVRLAAAGATLGLAEGVETALSATELHGVPCWATLGGQRLSKITLPAEVKTVHVFADNDEPGKVAAERAAHRYTSEGKHVTLHFPPKKHGDFNDALLARRAAA